MLVKTESNALLSSLEMSRCAEFGVDLVNAQSVELTISRVAQPETTSESSETIPESTSDQVTSEDVCFMDNSEGTGSPTSESGSFDSETSDTNESTTSDTDDENETGDSDTSTDIAMVPEATPAVINTFIASTNVIPSETFLSGADDISNGTVSTLPPKDETTQFSRQNTTKIGVWNDQYFTHVDLNNDSGLQPNETKFSKSDESPPIHTKSDSNSPCDKPNLAKDSHPPNDEIFASKANGIADIPTKSVPSASKALPPELAGGWGEEPEPAHWEWQEMPFDYMGILEEQRRTFSYDDHERESKEKWNLAIHKKPTMDPGRERDEFERGLIRDGSIIKNIGRGRGKRRFSGDFAEYRRSSHGRHSRHEHFTRDEDELAYGKPRFKDRGNEKFPRDYYTRRDYTYQNGSGATHTLNKLTLDSLESIDGSDVTNVHARSIIDTPNDVFETAGLVSPNPRRPSLPIAETKDEVKKSSAWTKEGKREREMSLLILPRPERITMPAAILPRPKKIDTKTKYAETDESATNSVSPKRLDQMNDIKSIEDVVHPVADTPAPVAKHIPQARVPDHSAGSSTSDSARIPTRDATVDPVSNSTDATQLLVQLVNLLRNDDKALLTLRSILNNLNQNASTNFTMAPPNSLTDTTLPDSFDSESPTSSIVEDPVIDTHMKVSVGAAGDAIVLGQDVVGSESPKEHQVEPGIADGDSTLINSEVLVYPMERMKSMPDRENLKSKDNSCKSNSKYSKHTDDVLVQASQDSIANPVSRLRPHFGGFMCSQDRSAANAAIAGACGAVVNDDLTQGELWYSVPDILDNDSLEGERLSRKRVYTLQDFKNSPPPRRSIGKLYEPPAFHSNKKSPPKLVASPGSGSTAAYNQTFQLVDAEEDLGIVSRPKWRHSATLEKQIEDKSLQKSSTIPFDQAGGKPKKPFSATEQSQSETPTSASGVSATGTEPSPLSAKPHLGSYDFNPPSPRRVTRRVVLSAKEASTQTSLPASPDANEATSSSTSTPRREAIHHPRYYNTIPRNGTQPSAKKSPRYTPETLPEWAKARTGADRIWIGTMKNVDAKDDLGVVSNPKMDNPPVDAVAVEQTPCVGKGVSTSDLHERILKSITQDGHDYLYALLTALSNHVSGHAVEEPKKRHKEKKAKKEGKEKDSFKDEKSHKERSKTKPGKSATSIDNTTTSTSPKVSSAAVDSADVGDVFGDLLGDEIPKWGILNPTA